MQGTNFDPNKVYNALENENNIIPKTPWYKKLLSIEGICNICLVIVIIIFGYSFLGDLKFKLIHAFPEISEVTYKPIDILQDPIQVNISQEKLFIEKGKNIYTKYGFSKIAQYSLSGMIVAINTDFWLRGLMRSDFDQISLMDIGIVWGDIANKEFVNKYMKFKSEKTSTARWLRYNYRCTGTNCKSFSYIKSHVAHTHLVPANKNVMSALLTLKKYDNVKLDGYLIDLYFSKGGKAITSISRTDNNAGSRGQNNGGGACEIMYVTQVQIAERIYK